MISGKFILYYAVPNLVKSCHSQIISLLQWGDVDKLNKLFCFFFIAIMCDYQENIDRDVILLRQNVVTSSGRTVIRPTRLDL